MAIGDTPNQNLFGTNYNAEDEERKKAELAAQGAMMGAGDQSFRGATGIQDIAGMQGVPQGGTLDPTQGARDLLIGRQFNRGGPVRISDMGSLIQDPLLRSFEDSLLKGQSQNNPFGQAGIQAGQEMANNIQESIPTESVSNLITNNPFFSTSETPVAAQPPVKNALLGMLERADAREAQGLPRQAAPGIIDAPVETPSVGAQEQPGAVVSPFLQSPDTPSDLGGPLLRGFDMVNDATRGPNAPMGQDATRAALGGMTLNEYLNAPAGTPGVSGLRTDPQGRMITPSAQPPVDSAVPSATTQPPVDALSSFEQDSLSRQQRIGGTGSFEGDSEAREAKLREMDRRPGESQADRDTRVAQSKTTGGQTGGLSFDDARRRAEGQLAARGVKKPTPSQVNALARSIQAGEPERLAELETKRALDAIKLRDEEAKKDFKPQIVEIGDQKLIQLSPNYYQPVRPEPTAEEPFEPRVLEDGGFTYYEVVPNRFERQPSTKAGGATGEVSSAIADAIAAGGGEVATTPDATSTSSAPVRINSQAEYDALPVGTPYIDSQGTETVKK